ncbi:MAG: DMT family transporter [Candidatus Pacebacteria bacterium]|nr:DMT family transporter [Candidatus Paceibacterota bacterium]
MFSWILITIIAHFLNAVVLIIDKHLVSNTVLRPVAYTFYSGIFQILFVAAIPIIGFTFPEAKYIISGILIGALFILSLLIFYKAIRLSAASRVIPVVGGAVPIFTFFLSYIFLGERLTLWQTIAFILLVLGGVVMSSKLNNGKIEIIKGFFLAILAGLLFAIYYTSTKFLFLNLPFFEGFILLQVGGFLGALALLAPANNRKIIFSTPKTIKKRTAYLFVPNKILAAIAAVMIFYAISIKESSVSVINSLQASQYVFLLILAIILSKKLPDLYNEQTDKKTIAQKLLAIGLIGIGLVLLVG